MAEIIAAVADQSILTHLHSFILRSSLFLSLRLTSSTTYSTATNATLIIGGVYDTFSVTTLTSGSWVPSGTNIHVEPTASLDVIFDSVTTGGTLTVTENSNPSPPTNFRIPSGKSYDITFSGSFSGNITICLGYNDADVRGNENNLRLFHRNNTGWTDITTSRNTVNNIVCGVTSSLSEFAIVEPLSSSPTLVGYNPQWLIITLVSLTLVGGVLLRRRTSQQ
jgi:hypothetical protein